MLIHQRLLGRYVPPFSAEMDTCTSSYTPQPLASFFHQIPHVNTSLLETPSVVAGTLSYFEVSYSNERLSLAYSTLRDLQVL